MRFQEYVPYLPHLGVVIYIFIYTSVSAPIKPCKSVQKTNDVNTYK